MKILVTGAAGFIGRHTIKELTKAGHLVRPLDRKSGYAQGYDEIWMDIRNADQMDAAFGAFEPDAVLHLAANSSLQKGIEDPVYDAENNIIGTINVLQAAKEFGCKRIVFASTSAVYYPWDSPPFREDMKLGPITPYGISKAACEMYIKSSGLEYVILRYGNVYGPGQKPLGENILIARALDHMLNGKPFKINGNGMNVRDFIYVGDVAKANLLALQTYLINGDIFNISSGRGYSVNEIVDLLKVIVGFDGEIEHGESLRGETREVIMSPSQAVDKMNWHRDTDIIMGLKRTVEAWKTKTETSESTTPASP